MLHSLLLRSLIVLLPSLLALAGCAASLDTQVVNLPRQALLDESGTAPHASVVGERVIGLSLSGGGMRAAAFSFGVLQALANDAQKQSAVIDELGFISSVSGGSLLAAYYGLNGKQTLSNFREKVLLQNMEQSMRLSLFSIGNIRRILAGGLNDRSNLANRLHNDIFDKASFSQLKQRPRPVVWINATDVYNRIPFVFTEPVFNALCSDLDSLSVAEAVHASMAVPLVFAPVVLEAFADGCPMPMPTWVNKFPETGHGSGSRVAHAVASAVRNYRNPQVQRYVKLMDGGVTDNYGLSSIVIARAAEGTPYAPMLAQDVVNLKRLLFIVVDSGRGPSGDWVLQAAGPSGVDLAVAATDAAIDNAARVSFDAFQAMLNHWQEDVKRFRCNLTPEELASLRHKSHSNQPWQCDDVQFEMTLIGFNDLGSDRAAALNQIPTRLTLSTTDIDTAISAGHDAAMRNPALMRYRTAREIR